ncbi:MAG: HD domain-containing protein [Patescibacteria group bacterium]|nr:HD domain-containing protein [Patescibacteria group bacterium]
MDLLKRKTIRIPISGDVDVTDVKDLIDAPEFQRLRRVSQVGTVSMVYPGGTHSRFVHSVGVYAGTCKLTQRWLDEGWRDKEVLKALEVYSLLHDIGHPPLSHITEYLFDRTHDENGVIVLEDFKDIIVDMGVSYELVKAFFEETNPLYKAVLDKNLGTDKLDYLRRDSYETAFGGVPEISRIQSYIYWHDEQLVLDIKSIIEAMHLQRAYVMMYKQVYLRKAALIVQRLIQKAVAELLDSELSEEQIWRMDDIDLEVALRIAKSRQYIQPIMRRFKTRNLPKLFLSLRPEGKEKLDRVSWKSINVFGVDEDKLTELVEKTPTRGLAEIERDIAGILRISPINTLVVPSQGGHRFVPKDMNLIDGGDIISMKEYCKQCYPMHFPSLKEEGKNHLCFWVCASGGRKRFARHAEEIRDYLLSL